MGSRLLTAGVLLFLVSGCAGSTPTVAATPASFGSLITGCGADQSYVVVGDDGSTLQLEGAGEAEGDGGLSVDSEMCALKALGAPDAVLAQVEATRAIDGMQSASWPHYKAKWTYHPDHGLDVILTRD